MYVEWIMEFPSTKLNLVSATKNASDPNCDMFSILDELENYRRPSDGSFEFKKRFASLGRAGNVFFGN